MYALGDADGNGAPNYEQLSQRDSFGAKARAAFARHFPALAGGGGGEGGGGSGLRLVVLPSSSRANAQPLAQKADAWRRVVAGE